VTEGYSDKGWKGDALYPSWIQQHSQVDWRAEISSSFSPDILRP